jgi:DNA-binding response OmpR family regulator
MARILLVEGEEGVARTLVRALAQAGHDTMTVPTGSQALALADDWKFDLAFVAASLPDVDGHTVTDAVHRLAKAPVVQLSESREQADRDAWRDGAEDYVVKPISSPEEAVRLVRAVLRRWRAAGGYGEILRIGPLELDTVVRHVRLDGRSLKLPPKEIALLARLMRNAGATVPREELILDVWGEAAPPGSRTLDVHIGTLRAHLGDDPDRPRFIHTVRGVGFRFSSRSELEGQGARDASSERSDGHRD